jgi:small subunit ribosomal protein S25e
MGGKKKLSLKQIQKAEKKSAPKKEKRSAAPTEKKSVPGITHPKLAGDKLVAELKKMQVLTPYSVASRFDLRLSIARGYLKDLERKGLVKFVSRSRNVIVYKPAD